MVVGDSHGNTRQMVRFTNLAGERNIQHILSLGDFGLWTHKANGHEYLDDINTAAEANRLTIYAVGGNHENWDHWNWFCENMPTSKGFALVRRRVALAPKVHSWTWAKKQFFATGGAVSIDRDRRLLSESHPKVHMDRYGWPGAGGGPRTEWWPNEQLTDEDVENIKFHAVVAGNMVDYMFSHDCSNLTPWKDRLKPDIDSQIHRQRIDDVLAMVKPKLHFHGHMHTKYDWVNTLGTGAFGSEPEVEIQTYGLEADFDAMHVPFSRMDMLDNWGVLDTETDEFAFKGAGMNFRSLESQ